jgi:hypothetical protein
MREYIARLERVKQGVLHIFLRFQRKLVSVHEDDLVEWWCTFPPGQSRNGKRRGQQYGMIASFDCCQIAEL